MRRPSTGWVYVHIAIDDHSRVSWATIKPDETGASAWRALIAAVRYYPAWARRSARADRQLGLLSLAGVCQAFNRLGIRHRRTKAYRLRANGKADRMIRTALREWAHARSYAHSARRATHLPHWLHHYNWHRPHARLSYQPPASRICLPVNSLLGLHKMRYCIVIYSPPLLV